MTCPNCGHTKRATKATTAPAIAQDDMTDAQLYAHHKATAPYLDLLFFLEVGTMNMDERAECMALLAQSFVDGRLTIARPAFYRRFYALKDSIGYRRLLEQIAAPAQIAPEALAECA